MQTEACWIKISIAEQRLQLVESGQVTLDVAISSASNGPGEMINSECTPRGWHCIRAKIGAGCAADTVFVGRRPTGERYSPAMRQRYPGRDWILTRILWLSGLEPGKNRHGERDTMRRYIYIHGCPDDDRMSIAASHGCVRMRNEDVIRLFDRVPAGTRVLVQEGPLTDPPPVRG